jgi:hypothetical protein
VGKAEVRRPLCAQAGAAARCVCPCPCAPPPGSSRRRRDHTKVSFFSRIFFLHNNLPFLAKPNLFKPNRPTFPANRRTRVPPQVLQIHVNVFRSEPSPSTLVPIPSYTHPHSGRWGVRARARRTRDGDREATVCVASFVRRACGHAAQPRAAAVRGSRPTAPARAGWAWSPA